MEKINLKSLKIGHHYKTPMGKKGYYLHTTKPNNFLGGDEIFYLHFVSKKGVHFTLIVTEQVVMESSGKDVLSVSDLVVHLEKLKANLKPYCDSKGYEKNCAAIDEAIRLYSGEDAEPKFFGVPASSFKALEKDPKAKKNLEELRKLEWEMLVERAMNFHIGVDLVEESVVALPQPDSLSVQVFGGYDRERHAEAIKKAKRELFNLQFTFNREDMDKGLREYFEKAKETKTEPTYLTTRNMPWFPKNTLVQLTKLKKWYTDLAIEGLIKAGYLMLQ